MVSDQSLWLRSEQGVTLALSALVASGTTPPAVTVTGTPVDECMLRVDVVVGGTIGTMTARISVDGGTSYGATFTPAATSYPIGATGLSVNFVAGTYNANNLYSANVYASAWTDVSGLTYNSAVYPTYYKSSAIVRGRPLVRVANGVSPDLIGYFGGPALSSLMTLTEYSLFIAGFTRQVPADSATPENNSPLFSASGLLGLTLRATGPTVYAINIDASTTITSVSGTFSLNTPTVFAVRQGGDVLGLRVNGGAEATVAALARSSLAGATQLGGFFTGSEFSFTDILCYRRRLSDIEMSNVSNYLMGQIGAT